MQRKVVVKIMMDASFSTDAHEGGSVPPCFPQMQLEEKWSVLQRVANEKGLE